MTDENANYGLVVSFEDQSPSYVNGFEAGGTAERHDYRALYDLDTGCVTLVYQP